MQLIRLFIAHCSLFTVIVLNSTFLTVHWVMSSFIGKDQNNTNVVVEKRGSIKTGWYFVTP